MLMCAFGRDLYFIMIYNSFGIL